MKGCSGAVKSRFSQTRMAAMVELLIIKPSSLGDIVNGLQVATSLKAQRNDLRISWIVRDIFAPLVQACEAVDHTYLFDRNGGTKGFLRLMREVQQRKFDYVFDMQGLLRTGLMTRRARAKRKVGRTDAREMSGLFYHQRVPLPPGGRKSHALDILLQFCPVLDAKPELRGKLVFRSPGKLDFGFATGAGGEKPLLMFPDSRRADKRWDGFLQLTNMLLRADKARNIIWAGDRRIDDKGVAQVSRFHNLTGNTSLASLPELVQQAAWVITNDSGPMHLAAALGAPTMAIFGPTDPERFGPYPLDAPNHVVVRAPVRDLKLLPPKEVYAQFRRAEERVRAAR